MQLDFLEREREREEKEKVGRLELGIREEWREEGNERIREEERGREEREKDTHR